MIVKNINGTSDSTCKCGTWLEHWKRFGGGSICTYCPETKCVQKPEVGAHVQKESDSSWYIIPLCGTHNSQSGQSLDISDYIKLVPANVSMTCGRR